MQESEVSTAEALSLLELADRPLLSSTSIFEDLDSHA
jgi:hypothetical protein